MSNHDWSILHIEVKTRTSINELDLYEDLRISPENLNTDFCEQPAKYAYWATVAAQARALVDSKKADVERCEDYLKKTLVGELDTEVRRDLEMEGEKVTEAKVTNGIYVHEKYRAEQQKLYDLKDELLKLQSELAVLDIAREAMNQRKDMLISLGAQMRQEGSNAELLIKEKVAKNVIGKNKRKQMED